MSNVNQLLSKALSTTSEDEAMACLRMARKKGGRIEESTSSGDYNGHDAKYWYDKAAVWYTQAKKTKENSATLHKWYKQEETENNRLRVKAASLERENEKLKLKKELPIWHIPLMSLQFMIIFILLALNNVHSSNTDIESTQESKHSLESRL
jgi:hypothetical protein